MSRIGKLPVSIPDSVTVSISGKIINFSAGSVKKTYELSSGVGAKVEDKSVKVFAEDADKPNISMFVGMDRSNIKNIVLGLQKAFKVVLEVNGVGYKAAVDKSALVLTFGYSHEILYVLPNGITAVFEKPNLVTVSGNDKVLVGQVASEIISFRKPEPYKGKGVKVQGKAILRKEGKKK